LPKLAREQAPYGLGLLRHLGVPPHEIEDAAVRVFAAMDTRLFDCDFDQALRTWIGGVCREVAAWYRNAARDANSRGN
jgi:hypothetical protein